MYRHPHAPLLTIKSSGAACRSTDRLRSASSLDRQLVRLQAGAFRANCRCRSPRPAAMLGHCPGQPAGAAAQVDDPPCALEFDLREQIARGPRPLGGKFLIFAGVPGTATPHERIREWHQISSLVVRRVASHTLNRSRIASIGPGRATLRGWLRFRVFRSKPELLGFLDRRSGQVERCKLSGSDSVFLFTACLP